MLVTLAELFAGFAFVAPLALAVVLKGSVPGLVGFTVIRNVLLALVAIAPRLTTIVLFVKELDGDALTNVGLVGKNVLVSVTLDAVADPLLMTVTT
jgi:hypothetical protein